MPLIYSLSLTLVNYDLAIGPPAEFVGLDNYVEAFTDDPDFWHSWVTTFLIIFPALTGRFMLGLGIALLALAPYLRHAARDLPADITSAPNSAG